MKKSVIRKMQNKTTYKKLTLILTVAAFLMTVVLLIAIQPKKTVASEYIISSYLCIEIEEGDTLWSLAEQYAPEKITVNEYINILSSVNNLQNSDIISGQHLVVPIYSTASK